MSLDMVCIALIPAAGIGILFLGWWLRGDMDKRGIKLLRRLKGKKNV